MLEADLGVRHAVAALGGDDRPGAIADRAHAWRPWRSYAVAHLWASLDDRPAERSTDRHPRGPESPHA
jgi:AraC family transcriptional regulator of adaptative response / DNA-3-methyladenine glycosylase II